MSEGAGKVGGRGQKEECLNLRFIRCECMDRSLLSDDSLQAGLGAGSRSRLEGQRISGQ